MKAKFEVQTAEVRVWCAWCCIRLARNEERIVVKDKTYHTHCYPKLHSTNPKPKARSSRA